MQYHLFLAKARTTGFPGAMEIVENLENHTKKFHAWKNHEILKYLNNHGKSWIF